MYNKPFHLQFYYKTAFNKNLIRFVTFSLWKILFVVVFDELGARNIFDIRPIIKIKLFVLIKNRGPGAKELNIINRGHAKNIIQNVHCMSQVTIRKVDFFFELKLFFQNFLRNLKNKKTSNEKTVFNKNKKSIFYKK